MTIRPRSHGSLYVRDERDDGSFVLGAFVALVCETLVLLALFVVVPALIYLLAQ